MRMIVSSNPVVISQSPQHTPVHIIPEGLALQEIKVAMGTPRQGFHLDVGVVYGIYDTLTVLLYLSIHSCYMCMCICVLHIRQVKVLRMPRSVTSHGASSLSGPRYNHLNSGLPQ